ncbi:MAG: hypothetical protein B6D64_12980 [Bacteroidetes bacterium 4484_276]|nr:MAG: hypothetical protein B6D64_12980 [Bacteroidetes bacterium 4484_276]
MVKVTLYYHLLSGKIKYISTLLPLLALLYISNPLQAQQPEPDLRQREAIISRIENIAERSEQELDYSDLLDGLFYYLENPLNINYAEFDEFKQLLFLSDFQISKIMEYRKQYGNFLTVNELQAIEGMDDALIRLLIPFITISEEKPSYKVKPKNVFKYGKHDLFIRWGRVAQEQKGYRPISDSSKLASPNSYYLGSPYRLYMRYGFNYSNKVRFGVTADKDPGEEFFRGSQPQGFDFYSAFGWLTDLGPVEKIVVGDFHAEFGQGLTLWTGLAFGKSPDAINIKRNSRGIRPNTSVNENLFMRGTATTVDLGDFEITGFYSSKKVDANVGDADTLNQEIGFVTSLQQTGYHRTNAEVADKNVLGEHLYGGHARFQNNYLNIGATAYKTAFDAPVENDGQLYKKYNFTGTENLNYGLDFNFLVSKFNFFGEFSMSQNGGRAYLAGMQAALGQRVSLSLLYRNYGLDYQNLYGLAFGEASRNQNERGFYTGMLLRLHKNWTFTGYADFFTFPWIRYRVDAPSHGQEYLAQLNYFIQRNVEAYFRFKSETKGLNSSEETTMPKIDETLKQSFRFHISYSVLPGIILKNRFEMMRYRRGSEPFRHGYLLYQDVMIRPNEKPYDITFRYAIFDTDTYDERIYAYENDVLYAFSIPAYYYKGSRFYILLKYEAANWLDLWARFATTWYSNQKTIGTGLDEIYGSTRSEVKLQVRIKF